MLMNIILFINLVVGTALILSITRALVLFKNEPEEYFLKDVWVTAIAKAAALALLCCLWLVAYFLG